MASEGHSQRGFSLFMPFLLGFTNPQQEQETRLLLINHPLTQSLVVIGAAKDGPPPASKAAIEALPSVGAGDERTECEICLDEWETGKEMPCGHSFHGECIEKWLRIHGSCPVCRFSLPVDEEEKKKRDEPRGAEGRFLISFSFSFGARGSEDSDEISTNSDSNSNSDSGTPIFESSSLVFSIV